MITLVFLTSVKQFVKLFCLLAVVILASFSDVKAQNIGSLEQGANGALTSIDDPVDWLGGNINSSKAHYTESMSAPVHLEVTSLVDHGTIYCLTMGCDKDEVRV